MHLKNNLVAQKNIELVLGGFQQFYQHMMQTQSFDPIEMRNFMDPIFERAGYRSFNNDERQTNILILNNGGVGDFILNSAAIREIRRLYSNAHITLVFFARAQALAEVCPYVDETIANEQRFAFNYFPSIYEWNFNVAQRLLRRRYDISYSFVSQGSTVLLSYMSGARERISHKYSDGEFAPGAPIDLPLPIAASLLTIEVPRNFNGSFHEVDDYLGLLDYQMHVPIANREIEVWYTPHDLATAENILSAELIAGRRLYAVCMGGSSPRKQWLIKKILEREPKIKFIILGGGPMDEQSAAIFRQTLGDKLFDRHIIDLTNKLNYRQSATILSLCDMYIGNDTGTMHMATAVKTPVLMLNCFAADLPQENSIPQHYYPYRVPSIIVQPAHALDQCRESKDHYGCIVIDKPHCIAQIDVETAFDAYNQLKKRIAENNIEPLFVS